MTRDFNNLKLEFMLLTAEGVWFYQKTVLRKVNDNVRRVFYNYKNTQTKNVILFLSYIIEFREKKNLKIRRKPIQE